MGHKRRARETNLSLPLSSTTVCCDSYFRPDHRSGCERERESERERQRETKRERERERERRGRGRGIGRGARKGERERRGERERDASRDSQTIPKACNWDPDVTTNVTCERAGNCLGKQRAHLVAIFIFIHLRHVTTHENTATRPLRHQATTKRPAKKAPGDWHDSEALESQWNSFAPSTGAFSTPSSI